MIAAKLELMELALGMKKDAWNVFASGERINAHRVFSNGKGYVRIEPI